MRQHGRRGAEPKNPLQNYFLLFVRASPMAVVFFMNIGDITLPKPPTDFIVIGQKDVPNVNVLASHPALLTSLPDAQEPQLFPHGDTSPYAAILVNGQNNLRLLNEFRLLKHTVTTKYVERRITPEVLKSLKPAIVDMLYVNIWRESACF